MASNHWKNMFPPHNRQRGVAYHRDGRSSLFLLDVITIFLTEKYPLDLFLSG